MTRMRSYNAVIERDVQTGLYVGDVPGWLGAHSQGETLDEVKANIEEVITMLLEDGDTPLQRIPRTILLDKLAQGGSA